MDIKAGPSKKEDRVTSIGKVKQFSAQESELRFLSPEFKKRRHLFDAFPLLTSIAVMSQMV